MRDILNELALFSGGLGGVLGTKLLGWRCIGYVERNAYRQLLTALRIKDGWIDEAPIFRNLKIFNGEGYSASYTGLVDVLTAGFPCQPFSISGRNLGKNDRRNLWPATVECIRIVRPKICLLENVPNLLTHEYIREIYGGLAEAGYDAWWDCVSAAEAGANHKRERWWCIAWDRSWILSNTEGARDGTVSIVGEQKGKQNIDINGKSETISVSTSERPQASGTAGSGDKIYKRSFTGGKGNVGNSENERMERLWAEGEQGAAKYVEEKIFERSGGGEDAVCDTEQSRRGRKSRGRAGQIITNGCWWTVEPRLGRVAHGVADRVDRIEAIGDGQVPEVVARVWRMFVSEMKAA